MGNLLKRFFSIDYMLKKDEILGSLPTTREVYKTLLICLGHVPLKLFW